MRFYISKIIHYRKWVILLTLLVTGGLLAQLRSLTIIIDPDNTMPQNHPYIATGKLVEQIFGNKFTVVVGITPKNGDIFQPMVLEKIKNITERIQNSPGSIRSNVLSIAARKAKNIEGTEDGMIVKPLMETVPTTPEEMDELKKGIARNPVYESLLVSKDGKTAQIVAEFKKQEGGFRAIQESVEAAIAPDLEDNVSIEVSGITAFLALLEKYSARMGFLFPLAVLIIGLIHYEAFRTVQALILPLVTSLLAVAWSLGVLGLLGEPFDVFNASTPILILAIAAGHAVQILKRYYEEYGKLMKAQPHLSPKELSELAVLNSLSKIGPVMFVACMVAALGFFSLMIFDIKSIRTFGAFTGAGVLSALVLELTFIPALRVMLPAPSMREVNHQQAETFWDRLIGRFHTFATQKRKQVYAVVVSLIVLLSLGGYRLRVDNSQKEYFYGKVQLRQDDKSLNEKMSGTNPLYILVEGPTEDSIKRPDVLMAMESLQHFIDGKPHVGKTISIVDFIKKMNQSMNADQPSFYLIPDSQDLVAQYLFLYSNSGEPGDFDSYVDNGYQKAVVTTFLKSDSTAYVSQLAKEISLHAKEIFPADVKISMGGGTLGGGIE